LIIIVVVIIITIMNVLLRLVKNISNHIFLMIFQVFAAASIKMTARVGLFQRDHRTLHPEGYYLQRFLSNIRFNIFRTVEAVTYLK
jgi:hypothetical protein